MIITINPKSVYGETKYYPACELSRLFARLLNQFTLTLSNLKLIKQMGYEIKEEYVFSKEQPFI